jgi:hypothetical protein
MKNLVKFTVLSLVLFSCKDPELEKQKAELKESSCRLEVAHTVSESPAIIELGVKVGMKQEIEDFMKLEEDSTITCDSLKLAWSTLTDKIQKKFESENK